jgi:hypothetical protein
VFVGQRLLEVSQPVLKEPRSPIPLRHSMLNWPRIALPSRARSFRKASSPSRSPICCSSKKATWVTSRALRIGEFRSLHTGEDISQLSDVDLNGGFGNKTTV